MVWHAAGLSVGQGADLKMEESKMTIPNRSSAVMQSRYWPKSSADDFPTPPWATRALCEYLARITDGAIRYQACREPTANRGHMVHPLREYFASVEASDVFDYGAGFPVKDYLSGPLPAMTDWTITNPPFKSAQAFITRALKCSRVGVAVLVRIAFLEGMARHRELFSVHPPAVVLQFAERVVIHQGRLSPEGSTATAYCWMMFNTVPAKQTKLDWIAPCRKRLERKSDYNQANGGKQNDDHHD